MKIANGGANFGKAGAYHLSCLCCPVATVASHHFHNFEGMLFRECSGNVVACPSSILKRQVKQRRFLRRNNIPSYYKKAEGLVLTDWKRQQGEWSSCRELRLLKWRGKKCDPSIHRKIGLLHSAVHRTMCFKSGLLLLIFSCAGSSGYLRVNYFSTPVMAGTVGTYFSLTDCVLTVTGNGA